jgi:PST family polysaccharide transporter
LNPQTTRRVLDAVAILAFGQGMALVLGLVTVKVIAVVAGPSAVGAFSLVRSLQQTVSTVGSFGGGNWIMQGMAARQGDPSQAGFVRAAWWILGTAALAGCAIGTFPEAARAILPRGALDDVFSRRTLALAALAGSLGILVALLRAQLLAAFRTGTVTRIAALSALVSALLAYPLSRLMIGGRSEWAAVLVIAALAAALVPLWLAARRFGLLPRIFRPLTPPTRLELADAFRIAAPTLMIFAVSATAVFFVRVAVADRLGVAAAGFYDAAWTLSTVGTGLLLTAMSSYLLPAAGIPSTPSERTALIESSLRITLLLAVPAILVLVVAKGPLVRLLYSSDFGPAREILRWMLVGEFFRATGWIIATTGYARGHVLGYGIIESIWAGVFVSASLVLLGLGGGPESAGIAYLLAHLCYAATWLGYARYRNIFRASRRTFGLWVAGLAMVVLASAATWHAMAPDLLALFGGAVACVAFCYGMSTASERTEFAALVRSLVRRGPR